MADQDIVLTPESAKQLGLTIAQGVREGMEATVVRQKTMGEYLRTLKTPAHPEGVTNMHHLKRKVYQNGYEVDEYQINNNAIDKCNAIVRPGRYLNRLVEVRVSQDADQALYLSYNNRTIDQRMENKGHWRNFEDLVTQIVAEQDKFLNEDREMRDALKEVVARKKQLKAETDELQVSIGEDAPAVPDTPEPPRRTFGKSKRFQAALKKAEGKR